MPLVKVPRFELGDRIVGKYLAGKLSHTSYKGTIVYIFRKLEVPKKKKLIKYYGLDIVNPKYGKLFGPMFEDRIVIQKCNKEYSVFPMAGYNRYFTFHKV